MLVDNKFCGDVQKWCIPTVVGAPIKMSIFRMVRGLWYPQEAGTLKLRLPLAVSTQGTFDLAGPVGPIA